MTNRLGHFCRAGRRARRTFTGMKKQVLFDLKAWLLVLLLLPLVVHSDDLGERLYLALGLYVILIAGFYPHRWLIRRYANDRKWLYYAAGLAVLLGGLVFLWKFTVGLMEDVTPFVFSEQLLTMAILLFLSTAVSYAYKGIWLQVQMEKARRRQVEAELNLLQSQVNPHFLFNTLNNIYAQNLSDHESANDMILHLADLMRYQTESSRKTRVKLGEEINFLHHYISLEKKRLNANTEVQFTVDAPESSEVFLPPMLFVPFVENAFKHGIGIDPGNFIRIELSARGEEIIFDLKNSLPQRKQAAQSTRTGLHNVKKRLDILYPDQYQLLIEPGERSYSTRLVIPVKR